MLEESLVKSRILGSFSTTTLFGDTPFDERAVAVRILEGKRLQTRSNILLQPLLECLILLNGNCIALETSVFLSSTKFDWSHDLHRELLFGVWKTLVPGTPLQITPGKSVVSEEWKEVGFQGKDPATDFRGVGLLGLVQLHYFISTRPTLARRILKSSQAPSDGSNDVLFYPFACAGINISAFLLSLLRQRKLCRATYPIRKGSDGCRNPPSSRYLSLVDDTHALEVLNELYCGYFESLGQLWIDMKPSTAMDFPKVFEAMKQQQQQQ